jgi:hypothetical protein
LPDAVGHCAIGVVPSVGPVEEAVTQGHAFERCGSQALFEFGVAAEPMQRLSESRPGPSPHVTKEQALAAAGEDAIYYQTKLRGASNAKAKQVLGLRPRRLEWLD